MSFKKRVCKNNSLSKPKKCFVCAADRFCHKQSSNTDIITN